VHLVCPWQVYFSPSGSQGWRAGSSGGEKTEIGERLEREAKAFSAPHCRLVVTVQRSATVSLVRSAAHDRQLRASRSRHFRRQARSDQSCLPPNSTASTDWSTCETGCRWGN